MSEISRTNVTNTGLTKECVRKGCPLIIVHTLSVCSQSSTTPCNEKSCMVPDAHGLGDCDPRFDPCLREEHKASGMHLVIDCIGTADYAQASSRSTDIVLYTGPKLVRYSAPCTDSDCVMKHNHTVNEHVLCDNPECPIGRDHLTNRNCPPAQAKRTAPKPRFVEEPLAEDMSRSNKVTLKTRAKRFVRNLRRQYLNGFNVGNDIIKLIASLPLLFGVLNGTYAFGMLIGVTATTMGTSPLNPIAALISASFYGFVIMAALSYTSKTFTFPGGTRFDKHVARLTTGYALLGTSCAFELATYLYGIAQR